MKNGGGGAPENKLLNENFLGFTLELLRFKKRFLPCHPEGKVRRISKKNRHETLYFVQNDKKCAFTLAEVLITLGIIGIIAAMTLPALIANYQTKATVVRLKYSYSLLSQGFQSMITDNGEIDTYGNSAIERADRIFELMPKYFKGLAYCTNNDKKCIIKYHNRINGDYNAITSNGRNYSFILSNGFTGLLLSGGSCQQDVTLEKKGSWEGVAGGAANSLYGTYAHSCASIWIDINGHKGPNTRDIDMFAFAIVKNGIVPIGGPKEKTNYNGLYNCLHTGTGYCTAWVLYNENMEYLRCDDLDWNGKKVCD